MAMLKAAPAVDMMVERTIMRTKEMATEALMAAMTMATTTITAKATTGDRKSVV